MNRALLGVIIRIQVHHILAFAGFAFLTRRLGKEREYRSVTFRGRRLSLWHRVQTRHSLCAFQVDVVRYLGSSDFRDSLDERRNVPRCHSGSPASIS